MDWKPEPQTAATRSKISASSEKWRLGRMCRKAGCERLGAQVRNYHLNGSRALKSLKFPMAQGQIMGLMRHLQAGYGAKSPRIGEIRDGEGMHPEAPAVSASPGLSHYAGLLQSGIRTTVMTVSELKDREIRLHHYA
jgi:hypothetical protein